MDDLKSNRDARVTQRFAGEARDFRLAWGELALLQEARDCGPFIIHARLQSNAWLIEDISETIRCGLIGGGMKPSKADKLVELYVKTRPPMENLALAQVIIAAALIGAVDEVLGENLAANLAGTTATTESTISPTASSDLLPSTA